MVYLAVNPSDPKTTWVLSIAHATKFKTAAEAEAAKKLAAEATGVIQVGTLWYVIKDLD